MIPFPQQGVVRWLVGGQGDSLMVFMPVTSDTMCTGKMVHLRGTVRAISAFGGVIKAGPVLFVSHDSNAEIHTGAP